MGNCSSYEEDDLTSECNLQNIEVLMNDYTNQINKVNEITEILSRPMYNEELSDEELNRCLEELENKKNLR